ncbi:hypothetical protein [Streptomyces sp. NPDC047525]|uniref:hypothetical protein n=1 Tax=Streptomyces sp. NPDC047525 TaxID=3155264 RepID=UPI003406DF3C
MITRLLEAVYQVLILTPDPLSPTPLPHDQQTATFRTDGRVMVPERWATPRREAPAGDLT